MGEGYALEPADLDAIVRHLGAAGRELAAHRDTLAATPDAGRSSQEIASSFALLAAAVGGLADQIATTSTTLSENVSSYRDAEGRTAETFGGLMLEQGQP